MNQQKGEMTIKGHIIGISILAIYVTGFTVGIMYISECTLDIFIPIWLIGKLPIYTLCYLVYHWKHLPSKYLTKSAVMMVIAGIIIQVEIIWQLAGTFNILFIMTSYNSDNTDSWQYCNTVLFHTSLGIMIVSWLLYISLIIFLIQQSKTTNPVQNKQSEKQDNFNTNKTKDNSEQQRTSKAEIRRIHGKIKQERNISNKKQNKHVTTIHKVKVLEKKPKKQRAEDVKILNSYISYI